MVLPDSYQVPRAWQYSGTYLEGRRLSHYVAITLYGGLFHAASTNQRLCNFSGSVPLPTIGPTTPDEQRWHAITSIRFGLFPVRSPLLGESRLISDPPATEMFHFAGLPSPGYVFTWRSSFFGTGGCPIRKSPDHSSLAAPRGLSQPATSFFDVYRLGIHRVLLVTSKPNLHVSVLRTGSLRVTPQRTDKLTRNP